METVSQREELHRTIWKIAEELRGSVDGWDFKAYVLGFLFYRFISENLCAYISDLESKDYISFSDEMAYSAKDEIVKRKGFFIAPSDLFSTILDSLNVEENLKNLNERLAKAFSNIQNSCDGSESEESFKGLFKDIDLQSQKLGNTTIERNKKLAKIMNAIGQLDLNMQNSKIDAFGDAYEYLMGMYASSAGKSGGEFFTPQGVSHLLAKLTLHNYDKPNKVYDPACGSGSLLLQYKKILHRDPDLGYFGQEINHTTYNLCRMNMFLHNVEYPKIHIAHGDTLLCPCDVHKNNEPFDAIISNPPYSTKWIGKDNPLLINDSRFAKAGALAPKSYADYAFIMHALSWLSERGSAAIVVFPGILYRGGAELAIRSYLIDENYIDSIIALPENLFFGTNIATCIMILKKNKTHINTLFIDASSKFHKQGIKNTLFVEHTQEIIKLYTDYKDTPYLAKCATQAQIRENGYNLSVSSYVQKQDTREKIDIKALNAEIQEIGKRQADLRMRLDSIIAELEGI